ncbi:MAG: hypothetical protein AVDCRST_MAG59-5382, partial [uncultured Thermomicrobiales bacterium]
WTVRRGSERTSTNTGWGTRRATGTGGPGSPTARWWPPTGPQPASCCRRRWPRSRPGRLCRWRPCRCRSSPATSTPSSARPTRRSSSGRSSRRT